MKTLIELDFQEPSVNFLMKPRHYSPHLRFASGIEVDRFWSGQRGRSHGELRTSSVSRRSGFA